MTNKYQKYRLKDVEGYRKKKREWARSPEQRKKRTEYMRVWREKNREKHNRQSSESQGRNKHKHVARKRNYHLKTKFNLTIEDYNKLFFRQGNKCKICKKENQSARCFHVDHDHNTGEVRGILCTSCNTKLGWYETNKKEILKYLIK